MGVANENSAAWGIAKQAHNLGAKLAFTYQIPAFEKRLIPLAKTVETDILIPCDVSQKTSTKSTMEKLSKCQFKDAFSTNAIGSLSLAPVSSARQDGAYLRNGRWSRTSLPC